jgi:hypothetical protein
VTLFTAQFNVIQGLIMQALKLSASAHSRVSLSPASAWAEYTNLEELWTRSSPPSLQSAADALETAETVLTHIEQACSDANAAWPKSLRGRTLLPSVGMLKRISINAVVRPDGSCFDHWLYRARPQLVLDGGSRTRVPVYGSAVEVRIGHMGLPIGIRSRWTPLAPTQKLVDPSPYIPSANEQQPASNGQAAPPRLAYLLEGDAVPQFYLAPYFIEVDEHGGTPVSASPFSLTVDIERTRQNDETMVVVALARGGSGDYLYKWGIYSLVRYEDGFRQLGAGRQHLLGASAGVMASSIELNNGAYIVAVNVKDRATGAFKHQQAQIYSSTLPILDDSAVTTTA